MDIPVVRVGVLSGEEIFFSVHGNYLLESFDRIISGPCKSGRSETGIYLESGDRKWVCPDNLNLIPVDPTVGKFTIHDVTIGIDFHWERKEDQVFPGNLCFMAEGDKIHAINIVGIEDYLESVISSEMSSTSSMEFLKAHAVISRSWLLAQVRKNKSLQTDPQLYTTSCQTEDELVRWYDREEHLHFDVCADDHCQRYQGITRATSGLIESAVRETSGEVLTFHGSICDARFSKCCGGITELFENVWEPVNHPYLQKVFDNRLQPAAFTDELTGEQAARRWIMSRPDAFCNSSDENILKQVLNDYDQETNDFFRWQVIYSQEELSNLVRTRTGIDFGNIIDLVPVERGVSGRLIRLKIIGTLRTMTIGKELEIRKTLSGSHLYSSAFIIEQQVVDGCLSFILIGAGWGHGVGLCQIGAAVMGDKGYTYSEILSHYFPGAGLEKIY